MSTKNDIIELKRPKIAICYDFDKTLSPDDMQTFTLIPSFGVDKETFCHFFHNLNPFDIPFFSVFYISSLST